MLDEIKACQSFNRYSTLRKDKAFFLKSQLDKLSKENIRIEGDKKYITEWRVGITIKDRIVIDIDSHNMNNLNTIYKSYCCLLQTEFHIIKTMHGFHLISKTKSEHIDYDRAQILKPILNHDNVNNYINAILEFRQILKEERENKEFTRTQLQDLALQFGDRFKRAGLFSGFGDFDILHAVNGLVRGKYTLRISKKDKDDRMILLPEVR